MGKNEKIHVIKIAVLPGVVKDIAVNGGTSISQAIEAADLGSVGNEYEARLNGDPVERSVVLSDGDHVLLVKKIKGA